MPTKGHIDDFIEPEAEAITCIFQAPQSWGKQAKKKDIGIDWGKWFWLKQGHRIAAI